MKKVMISYTVVSIRKYFLLEMQILHFTLELRILANVSLVTLPGAFFKNNSKSQNGIFGDFYF